MELSQVEVYNEQIDSGKSHNEAIDTIIDFWTGGLSASWESDKWVKARVVVEENLLHTV